MEKWNLGSSFQGWIMFRRSFFIAMANLFPMGLRRRLGPKETVYTCMSLESARYLRACILNREPIGGNGLADSILIGIEMAIFDAEQEIERLP